MNYDPPLNKWLDNIVPPDIPVDGQPLADGMRIECVIPIDWRPVRRNSHLAPTARAVARQRFAARCARRERPRAMFRALDRAGAFPF